MAVRRKFDNMGRICIPKEYRDEIGLKIGDVPNIEVVGDKIIISNPNKVDIEKYLEDKMEAAKNSNDKLAGYRLSIYGEILMKIKEARKI